MTARAKSQPPEIAEDRPFQERFWHVERFAWIGFGLLLLAAMAGFFGSGGPFSRGEAISGETRIDFPTQARWEAGEEINVRLAGSAGERVVEVSNEFAEAFEIDDIQPPPDRVEATAGGQRLVFLAADSAPIMVRLAMTPRHPGPAKYLIAASGMPAVPVSTFVWP
jgi:hypothetical protein